MKNESNFLPTISEVLIEDQHGKLSIQIDFDFSNETIKELKFYGELKEYFLSDITFLENELRNKRPYDLAKILNGQKISLIVVTALQNLFNDYLGVVPVGCSSDLLCACFGLTKNELNKLCQDSTQSFGEIMATTRATTGCGSCFPEVQAIFHDQIYLKDNLKPTEANGPFPNYKEWSYAETLVQVDDLRLKFLKDLNLDAHYFEISGSTMWKLEIKSETKIDEQMKKDFSLFVFSRTGLLISFLN